MKKIYVFSFALAAALLSACSSDPVEATQGGGSSIVPGADAYVSLSINLPTTSGSTRANDNFSDGETNGSEYAVNDGLLLILTGNNESEAKVENAYDLTIPTNWTDPVGNNAQITTKGTLTQKIQQPSTTGNIYALVLLNAKSQGLNKENVLDKTYKTLPQLTQAFSVSNDDAKGYLYMSNAPLAGQAGGNSETAPSTFTTLSPVNTTYIFATQEGAEDAAKENNRAADIYVERAAAKITVSGGTQTDNVWGGKVIGEDGKETDTEYTFAGWAVDNYNTSSYAVRDFDDDWLGYSSDHLDQTNYRFVSKTALDGKNSLFRTYWGRDVNYGDENPASTVDLTTVKYEVNNKDITDQIPDGEETAWNASAYVHENTFNVANQSKDNTTRVIIKVKFNGGEDFITDVLDGTNDIFTNKDQQAIKDALNAEGATAAVKKWAETYLKAGSTYDNIYKVSWVNAENPAEDKTLHAGIIVPTITIDADKVSSMLREAEGETLAQTIEKATTAFEKLGLNTNGHSYNLYLGGAAYYYTTLIKHFGDVETPYKAVEGSTYGPTATAEQNYLGRYGVLRNNWYQLTVNSISNIGSSTIPPITTDDDDATSDRYISVSINILPWAVRTQDIDL